MQLQGRSRRQVELVERGLPLGVPFNLPLRRSRLRDIANHADRRNGIVFRVAHDERRQAESHAAVVSRALVIAQRPLDNSMCQMIGWRGKVLRERRHG